MISVWFVASDGTRQEVKVENGRVKDELRLPESVDELRLKIAASAPLDTVLVNVTVTDRSPSRAQAIADAVGRQFANRDDIKVPAGVSAAMPATGPPRS